MAPLNIVFSNRFESLADRLFDDLAQGPADPFAAEQIIVPSVGVRRRLELDCADRFGVCANVEFSYLAQWLWTQIGHVIEVREASPFEPATLAWRVFRALGEEALVSAHPRLASYVERADAAMRFDLAQRVARLLEQYITYRPDWLAAWLEGKPAGGLAKSREDEAWQAALWRALMDELGARREHPSAAFFRAVAALGPEAIRRAGLPERAHLFCLPTIPPLYLDILGKLARWTELHLYVLNPCREYWFEIVDPKRLSYLEARGDALYRESGNRLLATWGQQTQAHIDLLFDKAEGAVIDDAAFEPLAGNSLLASVQGAILDLRDPEPGSCASVAGDRSIEVHVCHSLVRELEVLHDQLLAMLAGPDAPKVSDILVVTPRLEEAAPLIDAVFGTVSGARRIPYTITGLRRAVENPAAAALLALLDLFASRCKASAVYEFLQRPLVHARFGLGPDDLERIHGWFRAAGIRWGLDGAHRKAAGVPEVERHSFRDGLDRLFLGYAMGDVPAPFDGRLPAADPEGSEALALGAFAHFVDTLDHWHRSWNQAAPEVWSERLNALAGDFLAETPETVSDLQEVREAVAALGRHWAEAGLTEAIAPEVVRAALESLLDDPARGGMPSGRVTFTAMASLRSLPYRVVCIIGLNDGAFPSQDRPAEFDLIAQTPRRGDRQRRHDERNLFLDLLLAARERLYLSYTGRSLRDNAHLPPSTLLSELLDYVLPLAAAEGESLDEARRRLVVEHPLQAFSPVYFDTGVTKDPRLLSFNAEYCEALRAAGSPPRTNRAEGEDDREDAGEETAPFFPAPLAEPEPEWREPTLDGLKRFFRHPCRYLLEQRLGLILAEGDEELADDEPFVPEFFDRSRVAERLLPLLRAGAADAEIGEAARAGNEYPQGRFGGLLLERELARIKDYAARIAGCTVAAAMEPLPGAVEFEIEGEAWSLSGALGNVRASGLAQWRYDDTRPVDYLSGWIDHLFLNALALPGVESASLWISRDGGYRLTPAAEAQQHLRELIALYRLGLRRPLHFFPKSAWAYAVKLREGDAAAAVREARQRWEVSEQRHGEAGDAAYRLALRGGADPLDEEFFRAAKTVFGPLLDHLDDERVP